MLLSQINFEKLLTLSFKNISLGHDYLAFICDFTMVTDAYQASNVFWMF